MQIDLVNLIISLGLKLETTQNLTGRGPGTIAGNILSFLVCLFVCLFVHKLFQHAWIDHAQILREDSIWFGEGLKLKKIDHSVTPGKPTVSAKLSFSNNMLWKLLRLWERKSLA